MERKYTVERLSARRWRIHGPRNHPMVIYCTPWAMGVEQQHTLWSTARWPLADFPALKNQLGYHFFAKWEPPRPVGMHGWFPNRWAEGQVKRAVGRALYPVWEEMQAQADPRALRIQKMVLTTCNQVPQFLGWGRFYHQAGRLLDDLEHYRAARYAVGLRWSEEEGQQRVAYYDRYGYEVAGPFGPVRRVAGRGYYDPAAERLDLILERLTDWMRLFARDGVVYRSLARTLMNLPGNLPHWVLRGLAYYRLPRPVTDRLTLITAGYLAQQIESDWKLDVVWRSSREQLVEGYRRLARYLHKPLDLRRPKELVDMLSSVLNQLNRAPFYGDFHNWAERQVEAHRAYTEQRQEYEAAELARLEALRAPALPLPLALKGVTRLDSLRAIQAEAFQMHHCVDGYTYAALRGDTYLFHIDYKGQQATARVSPSGRLEECRGPNNYDNQASAYGSRVLRKWLKDWPEDLRKQGEEVWF